MSRTDNRQPDLIVYYNLQDTTSTAVFTDSIVNETFSCPLSADEDSKIVIGTWTINLLVFNITGEINKSYVGDGTASLYLPEGVIEYMSDYTDFRYNPITNKYTYPPNTNLIFPISNGTGDFLNSSGFVVVLVDTRTIRQVLVYFDK